MPNEVIPFAQTNEVPAHILAALGEGNIDARVTINQLSYRGKTWRTVVDGDEKALTRKNEDGDVVPVQIVNLVVLDHNKKRSRAYYEGDFVEGKNAAPTCFSGDGVTPDASVKEPCAATCAKCPNSVKGSKITPSGAQTTLCAPYKRLVVVPSGVKQIEGHVPLLLRLAQTSVWDKDNKENEAKGWFAWDQYLDMLRIRGAGHTAAVETRVKFDTLQAYPKLLFSASRWLNPDEALAAKARIENDTEALSGIINGKQSEDGTTGTTPAAGDTPAKAEKPAGPTPEQIEAAAAAKAEKDAAAATAAALVAKAAEKQRKKDELAAQMAALEAEEDSGDGGFGAPEPAAAATKPKAAKAKVEKVVAEPVDELPTTKATPPAATVIEAGGAPNGLKDMLADWDD